MSGEELDSFDLSGLVGGTPFAVGGEIADDHLYEEGYGEECESIELTFLDVFCFPSNVHIVSFLDAQSVALLDRGCARLHFDLVPQAVGYWIKSRHGIKSLRLFKKSLTWETYYNGALDSGFAPVSVERPNKSVRDPYPLRRSLSDLGDSLLDLPRHSSLDASSENGEEEDGDGHPDSDVPSDCISRTGSVHGLNDDALALRWGRKHDSPLLFLLYYLELHFPRPPRVAAGLNFSLFVRGRGQNGSARSSVDRKGGTDRMETDLGMLGHGGGGETVDPTSQRTSTPLSPILRPPSSFHFKGTTHHLVSPERTLKRKEKREAVAGEQAEQSSTGGEWNLGEIKGVSFPSARLAPFQPTPHALPLDPSSSSRCPPVGPSHSLPQSPPVSRTNTAPAPSDEGYGGGASFIFAFGDNCHGKLGIGSETERNGLRREPSQPRGLVGPPISGGRLASVGVMGRQASGVSSEDRYAPGVTHPGISHHSPPPRVAVTSLLPPSRAASAAAASWAQQGGARIGSAGGSSGSLTSTVVGGLASALPSGGDLFEAQQLSAQAEMHDRETKRARPPPVNSTFTSSPGRGQRVPASPSTLRATPSPPRGGSPRLPSSLPKGMALIGEPAGDIGVERGWSSVACGDDVAAAVAAEGRMFVWGRIKVEGWDATPFGTPGFFSIGAPASAVPQTSPPMSPQPSLAPLGAGAASTPDAAGDGRENAERDSCLMTPTEVLVPPPSADLVEGRFAGLLKDVDKERRDERVDVEKRIESPPASPPLRAEKGGVFALSEPFPVWSQLNRSGVAWVSCGASHVLAVSELGEAFSMGGNSEGQLGLGHFQDTSAVSRLFLPAPRPSPSKERARGRKGRVGMMSNGRGRQAPQSQASSGVKADPPRVSKASAGRRHSLWLTVTGRVFACGDAGNGRLGIGGDLEGLMERREDGGNSATAVNRPVEVSCRCEDLGWSGNLSTEICGWKEKEKERGSFSHLNSFREDPSDGSQGGQRPLLFVDIAAGAFHSVLIEACGRAWTSGRGCFGALGRGPGQVGDSDEFRPVLLAHARRVTGMAAASRTGQMGGFVGLRTESQKDGTGGHSAARARTASWGGEGGVDDVDDGGGDGEEGIVLPFGAAIPRRRPKERIAFVRAAAGAHHTLLLSRSGGLYSCGVGFAGRLGHGKSQKQRDVPTRIEALRRERVVEMAAGDYHSLCLTSAGDIYSWGRGEEGQLGQKDRRDIHFPRKIASLSDSCIGVSAALTEKGGGTATGTPLLCPTSPVRRTAARSRTMSMNSATSSVFGLDGTGSPRKVRPRDGSSGSGGVSVFELLSWAFGMGKPPERLHERVRQGGLGVPLQLTDSESGGHEEGSEDEETDGWEH
uniref:Uncharacterized protein n=1 Tax=Chromera velia CCMP2878 TaxID=1169474 RepID=A0A0G4FE58_9ALVE|eukprot:Cvel_3241.t1-p1 / transcript=Cvel_3241.t1 / gene=Cvel_3241 / organism=Chromera_velia_CCMP2878 / gene_product=E3 ubiquitin-protein ligase HERC2, putative / transcript_product=E3 ubiquitin-protein ligase HERC2, putative / location=Cvel_scaffold127:27843-32417(-) / protein_length=1357 / sequence_SO=supercontig / SO=protein_coding / is_pseudo=false